MFKNVAGQFVIVFAWDNAAGAPKSGDAANITGRVSKDSIDSAATNDVNPTEIANAPGQYAFLMTQGETNCNLLGVAASSSTADIDLQPVFHYPYQYLQPTTAGRKLDVNVAGEVGLDFDNTSGTLAAAQFASGFITATKFATGAIDAAALSSDAVNEIVDQNWDELQADHVIADSMGALATELAALNNISSANVLTQINAALDASISELGVAAPTATPTIRTAIMLVYMAILQKRDTTNTTDEIHNAAGTPIATATVSDDGVVFTKGPYT